MVLLDRNGAEMKRWWIELADEQIKKNSNVSFAMNDIDVPKEEGIQLRLDLGNWLELALRNTK
jgi:hypothetical protein